MVKVMLSTALVLAMAAAGAGAGEPSAAGKDLCLFETTQCPGGKRYNIGERYDRLTAEIAKGTAVYSSEEIDRGDPDALHHRMLLQQVVSGQTITVVSI